MIECTHLTVEDFCNLSSPTKNTVSRNENDVITVTPSHIKFPYDNVLAHVVPVTIWNKSKTHVRFRLILPQTDIFQVYCDQVNLFANSEVTIYVKCKPRDTQICVDCFEIQTPCQSGIRVLLELLPGIDWFVLPKFVSLPIATLDKRVEGKITLPVPSGNRTYDFCVVSPLTPIFNVSPRSGTIGGMDGVQSLTVVFLAHEYLTLTFKLQIKFPGVESQPYEISVFGRCVPNLENESLRQDVCQIEKLTSSLAQKKETKSRSKQPRFKLKNVPKEKDQNIFRGGVDTQGGGDTFGNDKLFTPAGVMKFLLQKDDAATLLGPLGVPMSVSRAIYNQKKMEFQTELNLVKSKQANLSILHRVERNGEEAIESQPEALEQILLEREKHVMEYHKALGMEPNMSEDLTRLQIKKVNQRQIREAGDLPKPRFGAAERFTTENYLRDLDFVRKQTLRPFIQAGRILMLRYRADQRIKKLRVLIRDFHKIIEAEEASKSKPSTGASTYSCGPPRDEYPSPQDYRHTKFIQRVQCQILKTNMGLINTRLCKLRQKLNSDLDKMKTAFNEDERQQSAIANIHFEPEFENLKNDTNSFTYPQNLEAEQSHPEKIKAYLDHVNDALNKLQEKLKNAQIAKEQGKINNIFNNPSPSSVLLYSKTNDQQQQGGDYRDMDIYLRPNQNNFLPPGLTLEDMENHVKTIYETINKLQDIIQNDTIAKVHSEINREMDSLIGQPLFGGYFKETYRPVTVLEPPLSENSKQKRSSVLTREKQPPISREELKKHQNKINTAINELQGQINSRPLDYLQNQLNEEIIKLLGFSTSSDMSLAVPDGDTTHPELKGSRSTDLYKVVSSSTRVPNKSSVENQQTTNKKPDPRSRWKTLGRKLYSKLPANVSPSQVRTLLGHVNASLDHLQSIVMRDDLNTNHRNINKIVGNLLGDDEDDLIPTNYDKLRRISKIRAEALKLKDVHYHKKKINDSIKKLQDQLANNNIKLQKKKINREINYLLGLSPNASSGESDDDSITDSEKQPEKLRKDQLDRINSEVARLASKHNNNELMKELQQQINRKFQDQQLKPNSVENLPPLTPTGRAKLRESILAEIDATNNKNQKIADDPFSSDLENLKKLVEEVLALEEPSIPIVKRKGRIRKESMEDPGRRELKQFQAEVNYELNDLRETYTGPEIPTLQDQINKDIDKILLTNKQPISKPKLQLIRDKVREQINNLAQTTPDTKMAVDLINVRDRLSDSLQPWQGQSPMDAAQLKKVQDELNKQLNTNKNLDPRVKDLQERLNAELGLLLTSPDDPKSKSDKPISQEQIQKVRDRFRDELDEIMNTSSKGDLKDDLTKLKQITGNLFQPKMSLKKSPPGFEENNLGILQKFQDDINPELDSLKTKYDGMDAQPLIQALQDRTNKKIQKVLQSSRPITSEDLDILRDKIRDDMLNLKDSTLSNEGLEMDLRNLGQRTNQLLSDSLEPPYKLRGEPLPTRQIQVLQKGLNEDLDAFNLKYGDPKIKGFQMFANSELKNVLLQSPETVLGRGDIQILRDKVRDTLQKVIRNPNNNNNNNNRDMIFDLAKLSDKIDDLLATDGARSEPDGLLKLPSGVTEDTVRANLAQINSDINEFQHQVMNPEIANIQKRINNIVEGIFQPTPTDGAQNDPQNGGDKNSTHGGSKNEQSIPGSFDANGSDAFSYGTSGPIPISGKDMLRHRDRIFSIISDLNKDINDDEVTAQQKSINDEITRLLPTDSSDYYYSLSGSGSGSQKNKLSLPMNAQIEPGDVQDLKDDIKQELDSIQHHVEDGSKSVLDVLRSLDRTIDMDFDGSRSNSGSGISGQAQDFGQGGGRGQSFGSKGGDRQARGSGGNKGQDSEKKDFEIDDQEKATDNQGQGITATDQGQGDGIIGQDQSYGPAKKSVGQESSGKKSQGKEGSGKKGGLGQGPNGPHELGPEHGINGQEKAGGFGIKAEGPLINGQGQRSDTAISTGTGTGKTGEQGLTSQNGDRVIDKNRLNTYKNALKDGMDQLHTLTKDPRVQQLETKSVKAIDALLKSEPGTHIQLDKIKELQNKTKNSLAAIRHDLPTIHSNAKVASGLKNLHKDFEDFFGQPLDQTNKNGALAPTGTGTRGKHAAELAPKNMKSLTHAELKHFRNHMTHKIDQLLAHSDDPKLRKTKEHIQEHINALLQLQTSTHHAKSHGGKVSQEAFLKLRDRVHDEIENIQQKVLNNEVTMHLFSLKKVINNMFGTSSGLKTPTKPKLKVQQQRISHALDRLYGLDGPISDAIVHDAQQKINEQFEETYLSAGDPVTTEDDITHKKIIGLQNIIQHEMDDLKDHITNPKIRNNMDKISHTLESFLQRASPRHSADISVDIKTVEDKLAKEFDKFSAKHHLKGGKDSHHKIKQAKSKILNQAQRLGKVTNEAPNPVQMKNLLNNIHSELKHLKDLTPNTNKAKIKDINELDHNVDVIFNQGHGQNMNRAELQEYQKLINDQFDDLATETGGSDENVKLARKKINEEIEKLLLSKPEAKLHGHGQGHPPHASDPTEDKFHQLHQHIKHDMEGLEKHISGVKPNGPHITEQLAAINHGLLQKYLTTKHHHHHDEPHHGHDGPLTEFLDKITKEYTKQHETHGIKDIKSTLKKITDQVHKFLNSNNKHHKDNKNEHIKDSESSSKLTNLPPHDHPNELKAKLNTFNAEVGELQNKIHNESIKQSQKIINNNINARINNNPVNPNAALKSGGKSTTVSATEKPPIITIGRPEIIQHQAKINTKLNNLQDILKNRDIDAQQQIINTAFNKLLELEKPLVVPSTKTTPTPTTIKKTEESDLLSKASLSTSATASQIMSTASAAGLFVKVDIVRARDEVNEAMNEFLGVLPNKEIDETKNRINNIVDNLTKKYEREKLVTEKKARKLAKLHAEMSQILGLTDDYNADEVASSSSRPKKIIKENKLNKSGATAANNNNPIPKEVVEQHQAKINDQFEKFLKRLPNVDVLKNQIKLNQVLDNIKGQKLNDPRNFKAKPLFDTEFKKLPKITMDELLQFKVDIGAEINKLQDKAQSQDIKDASDSFNGIMDKLVDNIQVPLVAPSKEDEDEKSLFGGSSTNDNQGGEEEDGEDSEAKILIPSLVLRKHLTNLNAQFENILDLGHVRKKRRVTKAITQVQNSFNSTFSQLFETVIKDGVIPMTKPEIIHFIDEINESYKAAPQLVNSTVFLEKVEEFNKEMRSFIEKLESAESAKAAQQQMQNATKTTPTTNDKIPSPHALEVAAMTQLKIINNQVKDLQGKIGNKELALLTKALNLNLVNKLKLPAAPSSENFDIEFTGSLIILEDTKSASGKKRGVGESGGTTAADKKRDSGVTYEKVSPAQFQNYLKNINESYWAIPDKFKTTSLTNVKDKMTQLLGSLELDAKTELINTNLNKINANMDQLKLLGLAPENKKNITTGTGTGTAGDDELDEVSQLQQLLNNALRAPLGLDVPLSAEAGNKTDEKNAADILQKLLTKEDLKSLGPTPDFKRLSSDKLDQTQANLEALLQEIGKLPGEMKTDALKPIEKVLRKKLENIQRQQELYKVPIILEKINKEINALQSKVQKPELFKLQHKLNSHLNEIINRTGTGAGHGKSSVDSDSFKLAPFAFELEPSSLSSSASLTPSRPKPKIQIEDLRKHKEKIMDEINNLPEVVKTGEFHRTKNAINTFLKELQRQVEKENSKFPGSELAEDIAKLQEKVDQEFKTLEMKLIGEAQAVSKTGFFDVRKPAESNSAAAHRQNLFRQNINKQVTQFHDRIHYETSKLREKVKHTKNFTSSMKNANLKILGDVDETVENEIKWLLDLVNELLVTSQSEISPISKTMKYPSNRDSLSLKMGHHQDKSSRFSNKFGPKSSTTGYSHLHRPKTRGRGYGRSIISGRPSQLVAAPKSVSQFTTTKGKFIPFVTKSSYQMKKPKEQNNNQGRLDATPKVSSIPLPQTTSSGLIQQPTEKHRTIGSHDYLQSRFFLSEASAQAILNELKISKQKAKHGNIKAYQL